METQQLTSNFLNNNIEEVIDALSSQKKKLPFFQFEDNQVIKTGYYSFKIGHLVFDRCWIHPFETKDLKKHLVVYRSGSYSVSIDEEVIM